jgi:peptidoglycan/LPS O-acetylase OafA/YrhL
VYIILDIARGWAALGVFLFHFHDSLRQSLPFLAQLTKYGSLGVQLFFVISGYVITAAAEGVLKNSGRPNGFLQRRFLRIFPPFWASILVVLALPYLLEGVSFFKSGHYIWPNNISQLLTVGEWIQTITLTKVFMATDGDLQGQFNAINSVYWTLGIEFQFYLCVYVALLFRRYFHRIILGITAVSLILIAFPLPLNSGLFIHFWPMFAAGIAVYYLRESNLTIGRSGSKYAVHLSAGLTLLSVSGIGWLAYQDRLEGWLQSIFPSVPLGFAVLCALILWFSEPLEAVFVRHKKDGGPIVRNILRGSAFLGVISYSLYLLHAKVLEGPAMIARQIFSPATPAYSLLVVGGTLAVCSVFHIYVEKPFMSGKQKSINDKVLSKE